MKFGEKSILNKFKFNDFLMISESYFVFREPTNRSYILTEKVLLRFISMKRNVSFYFNSPTNSIYITYQIFPLDLFVAKPQMLLHFRSTASV